MKNGEFACVDVRSTNPVITMGDSPGTDSWVGETNTPGEPRQIKFGFRDPEDEDHFEKCKAIEKD